MEIERKIVGAAVKAIGDAKKGRFEAVVSVFGNVDAGGDRVLPGAFERTLKPEPEGNGYPPVVWSHLWGIVPIGASVEAEEAFGVELLAGQKVDGLRILGELLVDDHQTAREVYAAMRQIGGDGLPPLRKFSFGYRPYPGGANMVEEEVTDDDSGTSVTIQVRELSAVELFEVGPTLVGMNRDTGLAGVKSLLAASSAEEIREALGLTKFADVDVAIAAVHGWLKSGARNSSKDAARLQQIHDLAVTNGATCEPTDDGKGAEHRDELFELLSTPRR